MQIDRYGHPLIQNHLHRSIEISKILCGNFAGPVVRHHGLRIHAEPHVIEPHRFDQRNIFRRGPCLKMVLRIPALVVNLSKPFAGVDAMPQPRRS